MKNFKKRLEEARSYLSYSIKEGYLDESEIEGLTDKELIALAEREGDRAEAYYDSLRDEGKI